MNGFEDAVVVVTGASAGIGRAAALGFAQAGAQVIGVARRDTALQSLAAEIRRDARHPLIPLALDLTAPGSAQAIAGSVERRPGGLNILVHAAGALGAVAPVRDLEPSAWDQAVSLNLTATFHLLQALDPHLRRAANARALFLTSAAAQSFTAGWAAYGASKAGFEALIRIYAAEAMTSSLRCVLIDPGPMRTDIRAQAFPDEDPRRLPSPETILPLLFDLARPDATPPMEISLRRWREGGRS